MNKNIVTATARNVGKLATAATPPKDAAQRTVTSNGQGSVTRVICVRNAVKQDDKSTTNNNNKVSTEQNSRNPTTNKVVGVQNVRITPPAPAGTANKVIGVRSP
ncbi:hypothetical protein ONZ45_g10505 [Pleurotus djamor]|nr:hypothetical protein ONZ45_g10505 [Pleurotus djamor]